MRRSIKAAGLLAVLGLVLLSCANDDREPAAVGGDAEAGPDEVFTDFVTAQSDSGLPRWRLKAPRANRYIAQKLVVLENPTVEFFNDLGELQTTLVSDSGSFTEDTQNMLAYGHVKVFTTDGKTLETDSLYWDDETEKIVTDSFVKLTEGRDVVTGYGLECDANLNAVDIKRDVKATITNEDGTLLDEE